MDISVDVGRSHCEVVRHAGADSQDGVAGPTTTRVTTTRSSTTRSSAGAGLGDVTGIAGVVTVVRAAVGDPQSGSGAHLTARRGGSGWRLAVALPGVETDPARAAALSRALAAGWAVPPVAVLVVSDSIAWQVGAFAGADGVVLAVGTGAVAVGLVDGGVNRADGYGLLLGDDGGGAWVGREALRAAVRGHAALRAAGLRTCGPAADWPGLAHRADGTARLASLVPDVVRLAGQGDPGATDVLDRAAAALGATLDELDPPDAAPAGSRVAASTAAPRTDRSAPLPAPGGGSLSGSARTRGPDRPDVAVVGGVGAVLTGRLRALDPRRRWVDPRGDACCGAHLLLDRTDTAFEPHLLRHRPRRGATDDCSDADGLPTADTDGLPTEGPADDTADLDTWPAGRLVARLVEGHGTALAAARSAVPALTRAVALVATALGSGGRLVYLGAGTPGRLALQDAAELTPTFGLDPARVPVLLAGGPRAGGRAVEGAEDDGDQAGRDVDAAAVGSGDVVVGISASGRTPYVLAGLARARARGAATVGISCVPGSRLTAEADLGVDLPTGPEVVAGSTRLAAGTAQKIALNTLSTAAMVTLGATHGPWMVDVQVTNDKLRRRAVRIVRDVAAVSDEVAERALETAGGSVRVALVMTLAELGVGEARRRLRGGVSVRSALTQRPRGGPAGTAD